MDTLSRKNVLKGGPNCRGTSRRGASRYRIETIVCDLMFMGGGNCMKVYINIVCIFYRRCLSLNGVVCAWNVLRVVK